MSSPAPDSYSGQQWPGSSHPPSDHYSAQPDAGFGPPALHQPHYGISPMAAVTRAFAKYARFDGRAGRGEYWWFQLLIGIAFLALGLAAAAVGVSTSTDGGRTPGTPAVPLLIALVIGYLALVVPSLSLLVRRLHDAGFSGWLALLALLPSVGAIILVVLAALPSTPAGARFDRGSPSFP